MKKMKTPLKNLKSTFPTCLAIVAALCAFAGLDGDVSGREFTPLETTWHVEVLVRSTHVSEGTTSTNWRTVVSTEWREFAEWYHDELWAEFIARGDVFPLLFDPAPTYDESVIDIRLRSEISGLTSKKSGSLSATRL
jgi:hypothetical protein